MLSNREEEGNAHVPSMLEASAISAVGSPPAGIWGCDGCGLSVGGRAAGEERRGARFMVASIFLCLLFSHSRARLCTFVCVARPPKKTP